MGIFSGCLLATDIDGSIVDRRGELVPRNIEAFEFFKKEGGLFTLASGRVLEGVLSTYKGAGCNAPAVIANGAIVYDVAENKTLCSVSLPEHAKKCAAKLLQEFADAGAIILSPGHYFVVRNNKGVEELMLSLKANVEYVTLDEIMGFEWTKAHFISDDEPRINEMRDYGDSLLYEGIYFVKTAATYLEMTEATNNKAEGIRRLLPFLPDVRHVYTFGDYDNDIEMLKFGKISGTVAEATPAVRAAANFVAGPCESGAAADFVYYLADKLKG